MTKVPSHGAAGQALGYVYQVGWGLLELASPGDEADELRLESLDDVTWEDAAGNPLTALQIKHHSSTNTSLTDKSVDFWRTVTIWLDEPRLGEPDGPILQVITTQAVAADCGLALLGQEERDETTALERINEAARTSRSTVSAVARRRWLEAPVTVRTGILRRLTIVWGAPTAEDVAQVLGRRLANAMPVGREAQFVNALLGWWWRVSVDLLSGRRETVRRIDLRMKLDDLREQVSYRSLPVDWESSEQSPVEDYADRPFAQQIRLIGGNDAIFLSAVRDYLRAYAHLQYWVENSFAELSELRAYEERLCREWELQWNLMQMRLGPNADEAKLVAEGQALFERAMNFATSLLRPGFSDPFYSRGTQHRLAEGMRIGWHPYFRARLAHLLSAEVA